MDRYTIDFEYSDSGAWNTDVGQPATSRSIQESKEFAITHLSKRSSQCNTRVRIKDAQRPGMVREITNYGHSDSGWINES